jgi:hypothetical protein
MVNKKFGWGILVMIMVLVFGMTFAGCSEEDDSDKETNMLDKMDLSTGNPSALDKYNLDTTKFNGITTAGGGGYKGYEVSGGYLYMVWTGQSSSDFDSVASFLKTTFSLTLTNDGKEVVEGVHLAKGDTTSPYRRYYLVEFYPKKSFVSSSSYYPAGTMIVSIPRNAD